MKQQSQLSYIESLLKNYGKVSRNHCLEQRITRLGAIINVLNQQGWEIKGGYEKKNGGKDYVYVAKKTPYITQTFYVEGIGEINRLIKNI